MKLILLISLGLIWGCSNKNNQEEPNSLNMIPWSLNEPQIANKKGKIFLTNVQHQSQQPLELTDRLIFDINDSIKGMQFTTQTRCYDSEQKELIEQKSFPFQQQISIQKLMPKDSFHPKYIIKKQALNCTFKFTVQKPDGSSHNFRLYSQSVNLSEQESNQLIKIAGANNDEIKVLEKNMLHAEHFIIPSLNVQNLELICQSLRLEYLAQKNILNPFYGFNINSVEKFTYPRELCRVIGVQDGNYILSKPFQIEFEKLEIPFDILVLSNKYNFQNKNIGVIKIRFHNPYNFPLHSKVSFPNQVMINKMGTNYSAKFQVEYIKSENIKKITDKIYNLKLKSNETASFRVYTDLTRACFTTTPLGLGSITVNDRSADVYFPPNSLKITTDWHPGFYYKQQTTNNQYICVTVHNRDFQHPLIKGHSTSNKVNENYTPQNTNGCLNTPPRAHTVSGQISPF